MADIYRYEWTGVRTGYSYRLDIIEAQGYDLSASPDVYVLNDDALDSIKSKWEFDTYPFGLASPVRLSLTFRMKRIPAELKQWLVFPRLSGNSFDVFNRGWYPGGTGSGFSQVAAGIELGTQFRLYLKPPGGAVWSSVYVGMQDLGFRVSPKFPDGTITVEVEDALRAAMKAVKMDDLDVALRTWAEWVPNDVVADTGANEFVWSTGDSLDASPLADRFAVWSIGNVVRGDYEDSSTNADLSRFWFVRWNDLLSLLNRAIFEAFATITRNRGGVSPSFGVYVNAVDGFVDGMSGFYRQTYDRSPTAGTQLADADLYVLGLVASNQPPSSSSRIAYTIWSELGNQYSSAFDYIADGIKNGYRVAMFRYIGNPGSSYHPYVVAYSYAPLGVGFDATIVDITEAIRPSFELSLYDLELQNATASTAFRIGEDYDKTEKVLQYSRGDLVYTIPVVHGTMPVANKYEVTKTTGNGQADRLFLRNYGGGNWYQTRTRCYGSIGYGYAPRMLGFYYRANPSATRDGSSWSFWNENRFIRVHSFHPFANEGETPTPPATSPVDPLPNSTSLYRWDPLAIVLAEQRAGGTMRQLSDKFGESFYSNKSTTLKGRLRLDIGAIVDLVGDTTEIFAFTPYLRRWQFDASAIDASETFLADVPSTYYMTSADCDLVDEIAECQFWGK